MNQSDIGQLRRLIRCGGSARSGLLRPAGPDSRRLTASREGIQVHAWTAERLSACIAYEEEQHGWPATHPRAGRGSLRGGLVVAEDWDGEEVNRSIARGFDGIG
jgi:hypothetical protein